MDLRKSPGSSETTETILPKRKSSCGLQSYANVCLETGYKRRFQGFRGWDEFNVVQSHWNLVETQLAKLVRHLLRRRPKGKTLLFLGARAPTPVREIPWENVRLSEPLRPRCQARDMSHPLINQTP